MASVEVVGTFKPDCLIAGTEVPVLTAGVLLASGQGVLKRGAVIGTITTGGKGKLCNSASSDGSQVAKYVLSHEVDTTGSDKMSVCYKTGPFDRDSLIFGGTDTAAMHEAELRDVGIHLFDKLY